MGINLKDYITEENVKLSRSEIRTLLLEFFDFKVEEFKTIALKDYSIVITSKIEFNMGFTQLKHCHSVENMIKDYEFDKEYSLVNANDQSIKYLGAA